MELKISTSMFNAISKHAALHLNNVHLRAAVMRHEYIFNLFKTDKFSLIYKAIVKKVCFRFTSTYKLTKAQPSSKQRLGQEDFIWSQSLSEQRLWYVSLNPNAEAKADFIGLDLETVQTVDQPSLIPCHSRLLIIHAFYATEAMQILDRLQDLRDYDIIVTTPRPDLADLFLSHCPQILACIQTPNIGRDILPFILALSVLDVRPYQHFIKVHTKRSSHAHDGGAWFYENLETLIGSPQATDYLLSQIEPDKPCLLGCQVKQFGEGERNNRFWLKELVDQPAANSELNFIPGTMFMGNGRFLSLLAKQNLWKYPFESEKGQLDGCLHHALERFFGYLCVKEGGICDRLDTLLKPSYRLRAQEPKSLKI
jgi:lipopolysaccharide biosynthesis protein